MFTPLNSSRCHNGTFGPNCSEICTCPDNAYGHCARDTGSCTCIAGWTGPNCTEGCSDGHYGDDCSSECHCSNNGTCDRMIGCKCTPGWTSPTCNTRCHHNTFGHSCNETCICNSNQTCDPVDGQCECKPGWTGDKCHTECGDGMYGYNCSMTCTCDSNHSESCTKDLGICNCNSGYFDSNCSQVCPIGYHDKGCSKNCSHCTNTPYCDPVNGTCICLGKTGDNCTEDCDNGKYGIECEMPCNCTMTTSRNTSCHNVTGQCSCQAGWDGNTCDKECEAWTYGEQCSMNCTCDHDGTKSCDRFNGSCDCLHGMGDNRCSRNLTAEKLQKEATDVAFIDTYRYHLFGAGCGLVAVFAVILIVFVIKRRRKRRKEKDAEDTEDVVMNPSYDPFDVPVQKEGIDNSFKKTDITPVQDEEIPAGANATGKHNVTGDTIHDTDDVQARNINIQEEYTAVNKLFTDKTESVNQEIYNELENNFNKPKPNPVNNYTTFAEVKKLQMKEGMNSNDEEDYDLLDHRKASMKNKQASLDEEYSNFKDVKDISIDKSAESDKTMDQQYSLEPTAQNVKQHQDNEYNKLTSVSTNNAERKILKFKLSVKSKQVNNKEDEDVNNISHDLNKQLDQSHQEPANTDDTPEGEDDEQDEEEPYEFCEIDDDDENEATVDDVYAESDSDNNDAVYEDCELDQPLDDEVDPSNNDGNDVSTDTVDNDNNSTSGRSTVSNDVTPVQERRKRSDERRKDDYETFELNITNL